MINVTKGWPNGCALEASYPVAAGVDVVEGDFLQLADDGSGNPVWQLAAATTTQGVADTRFYQALDTNTAFGYDTRYTGKLAAVGRNYTAQTDRFVTNTYAPGDLLMVSATAGKLDKHTGSNGVVGVVVSFDSAAGILTFSRP